MSSYPYSSLPPGGDNIRLLRLLPNEDEAAPLRCELCNYSLQKQGPRTHLYEALSYVWGDASKTLPIYIDNNQFPITTNLHAALSRLRDHSFERIMWVDAICINQKNPKEQGQQVQLMAKIYSNAHRVIVWLGEEAIEMKGALEYIRLAASGELTESSEEEENEAIPNLLQRPWFQRIWVLQEVAAAQHIVMMCGSTVIDGYAFCLGVKSLKLSFTASPELQALPSVLYLIERASLRPKYTANLQERFSLNIQPLAGLVDMFHTRQAKDPRDKVYALLGMSLDDPSKATLLPDYTISWGNLFEKLVKYILGEDTLVESSSQTPKIKSKGCILGQVSSVRRDNRQNVNITFTSKNATWYYGVEMEWTLQASAKPIQESDIICVLQGASKPTIIRLCKDDFAIIIVAVTPLKESRSFTQLELSKSITRFPRGFLLVWDWEQLLKESQDRDESNNFNQATKIWNVALILGDLEEHEKAEKMLREAIKCYEMEFGEGRFMLKSPSGLTPLSWAAGNGYNAVVNLLLAEDIGDPDSKDRQYNRTPLSWAAEYGHEAVVKLLLATGKVDADTKDKGGQTPLSWAAEGGHEAVLKLLLATGKVNANTKDIRGRTPLSWAAKGGYEAVLKLLLATGKVKADTKDKEGRTPLSWAAQGGHEAVVKLLFTTSEVEADIKDTKGQTPLLWAAQGGYEAVVKLLLVTGKVDADTKDTWGQTPLLSAVQGGHEAVVELLLATGQVKVNRIYNEGRTPLSWAAQGGYEAVVKLLLATSKVDADIKDKEGRTPLSWAARNGYEAVVKLLLATGKVDADTKDKEGRTPLSRAAQGGHKAVVKLLREHIS